MHKREFPKLVHPYWNIRDDLLVSDDDFVLKGTRLVIPAGLRKHVLADLHASHWGIEGTKARARLIVYCRELTMTSPIHVRAARNINLFGCAM